ncbi:hypothetical protein [Rhodopseudomonas palustris]|uniref:hypothetical protein n=1 Tax=Rhodopseudomonas palustris TaxID=1076 RepID=UPI001F22EDD4|nr:hypothetical protein [Rhodopseudomonas palustris]
MPAGKPLRTLADARRYILALPEATAQTTAWQAAIEALLVVVEHNGPTDFARMGIMAALNPKGSPVYDPRRKDPHWGRRKLKRDL